MTSNINTCTKHYLKDGLSQNISKHINNNLTSMILLYKELCIFNFKNYDFLQFILNVLKLVSYKYKSIYKIYF